VGFTLEDIRSLAGLHDRLTPGAGGCAGEDSRLGIAAIAQQRLRQIDENLRQLSEMRAHLLALCGAAPDAELRCPATLCKILLDTALRYRVEDWVMHIIRMFAIAALVFLWTDYGRAQEPANPPRF